MHLVRALSICFWPLTWLLEHRDPLVTISGYQDDDYASTEAMLAVAQH